MLVPAQFEKQKKNVMNCTGEILTGRSDSGGRLSLAAVVELSLQDARVRDAIFGCRNSRVVSVLAYQLAHALIGLLSFVT